MLRAVRRVTAPTDACLQPHPWGAHTPGTRDGPWQAAGTVTAHTAAVPCHRQHSLTLSLLGSLGGCTFWVQTKPSGQAPGSWNPTYRVLGSRSPGTHHLGGMGGGPEVGVA